MVKVIFLVLFCISIMVSPTILAQAPESFIYHGRIIDTTGAALPGSITFQFYENNVSQIPMWSTNIAITPDQNGIFTAEVDFASAPDTLFNGNKRYLEVRIGTTILENRQLITSVPYAINALNSQTALNAINSDTAQFALNYTVPDTVSYADSADFALYSDTAQYVDTSQFSLVADTSHVAETILDNTISTPKIINNAVNSSKIENNSITAVDLFNEPGVVYTGAPDQYIVEGDNFHVVLQDSISCPASGYVLVMASLETQINHTYGLENLVVIGVNFTPDSLEPFQDIHLRLSPSVSEGTYSQVNTVHGVFSVPSSGVYPYYLISRTQLGEPLEVWDRSLSLIYIPSAYGEVWTPSLKTGESSRDTTYLNEMILVNTPQNTGTLEQHENRISELEKEIDRLKQIIGEDK